MITDTEAALIKSIFCETMPDAAIASGLVSPVDHSAVLIRLWATYGAELVHASLGLDTLCELLASRGETVGRGVVKEWRNQLMLESARITTGGTPRHLTTTTGATS